MKTAERPLFAGIASTHTRPAEILGRSLQRRGILPIHVSAPEELVPFAAAGKLDLVITSEGYVAPVELETLPKIVVGDGKRGQASRAIRSGAETYIPHSDQSLRTTLRLVAESAHDILREKAQFQRANEVTIGDITANRPKTTIKIQGKEVSTRSQAALILAELMENVETVVSVENLLDILPAMADGDAAKVHVLVYKMRKNILKEYGKHVISQKKPSGYMFVADPDSYSKAGV